MKTDAPAPPVSGWCSAPPGFIPPHEPACLWDLCQCSCHDEKKKAP